MWSRRVALSAVLTGAIGIVGCAASDHDQVKGKVQQFASAVAGRDYKTICTQVLAPELLVRLKGAGIRCEQAMQIGFGRVRKPTLSVGRITINGAEATVLTLSAAQGQRASLDSIGLVKTDAGWRISSLGSPLVPGRGR